MKNEINNAEEVLTREGYIVLGVDEAGRGPLAGPVTASAFCRNDAGTIDGVTDSKALTAKKREVLFQQLTGSYSFFNVNSVSPGRIDQINILKATEEAMHYAIQAVKNDIAIADRSIRPPLHGATQKSVMQSILEFEGLLPAGARIDKTFFVSKDVQQIRETLGKVCIVLVDGRMKYFGCGCQVNIIKGDYACYSIAAASILAKVSRDQLMEEYDRLYPEYHFAQHKGYGTRLHIEMIRRYGLCDIHRKSYNIRSL